MVHQLFSMETFLMGNLLTGMSPNVYRPCRGLILLAGSCLLEFLLALGQLFTVSVEPCGVSHLVSNGNLLSCNYIQCFFSIVFQGRPSSANELRRKTTVVTYDPGQNKSYVYDDDDGIMSDGEANGTPNNFRRNRLRSSLPIVRTPSKTLEKPLGKFSF